MVILVLERLDKSRRNHSALVNILDLSKERGHIKFTISKYQQDIFVFICTAFLLTCSDTSRAFLSIDLFAKVALWGLVGDQNESGDV